MKKLFSQSTLLYNKKFFQSPFFRFSTARNTSKNYDLNFPYKLDGLNEKLDIKKAANLKMFLSNIFDDNIENGFKFAFKNSLLALEENDLEFFEENCEPKLYEHISQSFEDIKSNNYTVKCLNLHDDEIISNLSKLNFFFGVKVNRKENFGIENYMKQEIDLKELQVTLYMPKTGLNLELLNMTPFFQIEVTFNSPLKIQIYDKNGNKINKKEPTGFHKIIFEFESGSNEGQTLNIYEKSRNMLNLINMKNFYNVDAQKDFINNFLQINKNYTWKICDIDDYLRGNPHAI